MNWFEHLTGFRETSPHQVRENLSVEGDRLISHVNGAGFTCGPLETPSLEELRDRVQSGDFKKGKLTVRQVVGDVKDFHAEFSHAGALFQVASQFNLLEMVGPDITPEAGVGIYENDLTQGPACAIAAGAGTIYRNYFVLCKGQVGQSVDNQIDCLADMGNSLDNTGNRLWEMQNGYALATKTGLLEIQTRLRSMNETDRDQLRQQLRIGVQWNTQVTIAQTPHLVTQTYCSALPVGYSSHDSELWEEFARLILEASYEATICSAIVNAQSTGNHQVFLTLLGGGVFGNSIDWILDAMKRSFRQYQHYDLDVAIVSYGKSNDQVTLMVQSGDRLYSSC